jgi:hypothetical protein
MNKRWLVNVILFIAIALLALVLLLQPGIEKPVKKERISAIRDDEISRVTIERGKAPTIVLARKTKDSWRLVKPRAGRANPFTVSGTLRVIRAQSEQHLTEAVSGNLDRYGLVSPIGRVLFDDHVMVFGDTNPVNNQQYVLFDKQLHMIDHRYFQVVSRNYTEFLSRQLIEPGLKPVKVKIPGLTLSVVKGSWRVTPAQASLPADSIKQLADDWQHAQALFVKPYEKAPVQNWVTLWFAPKKEGAKQTTLRVGIVSKTPELILYRPDEGLQYHFPQDLNKRLLSFGN